MSNENTYTKIIEDERQFYIYPMASSIRGGAIESEYNIRNLMSCLFSSSCAKTTSDFLLKYNDNGVWKSISTPGVSGWFTINGDGTISLNNLAVDSGLGSCNGYYLNLSSRLVLDSEISLSSPFDAEYKVVLGINWGNPTLASGVSLKILTNSEYEDIRTHNIELGLLDAGILLGTIYIDNPQSPTSLSYVNNPYIMGCIDIDKLGSEKERLSDTLYSKLNRLYSLMIDSGIFQIGVPLSDSFDPSNPGDLTTLEERNLVSKYKLTCEVAPPDDDNVATMSLYADCGDSTKLPIIDIELTTTTNPDGSVIVTDMPNITFGSGELFISSETTSTGVVKTIEFIGVAKFHGELEILSSGGAKSTLTSSLVSGEHRLDVSTAISAPKVYGAVWM